MGIKINPGSGATQFSPEHSIVVSFIVIIVTLIIVVIAFTFLDLHADETGVRRQLQFDLHIIIDFNRNFVDDAITVGNGLGFLDLDPLERALNRFRQVVDGNCHFLSVVIVVVVRNKWNSDRQTCQQ